MCQTFKKKYNNNASNNVNVESIFFLKNLDKIKETRLKFSQRSVTV